MNFLDMLERLVYSPRSRMLLDTSLLRRARLENVERLAKAMGVDAPSRRRDSVYHSQLVNAVASRIRREAMMEELKRLTTLRT